MEKNSKIFKIFGIVFVVILLSAICFFASLSSNEKYSSTTDTEEEVSGDILQTAIQEAGEVSESEREEPHYISVSDYLERYQSTENSIILFTKDSCEYCKIAMPILENIIYQYGVEIQAIDIGKLSDEDKNALVESDDYFKEGMSTPLLLVVGNHSIVDMIEGLVDKESYLTFFKEYKFME